MAIAFLVGRDAKQQTSWRWFAQTFRDELLKLDAHLDIRIWPEIGDVREIECVAVWKHPLGVLNDFPNLKCIIAISAGVDHVFQDPQLPKNIPVVRIVDPYMACDIVQYVVVAVLNYVKRVYCYAENQEKKLWAKKPPFTLSHKTVGMMGVGFLGGKAAAMLHALGLRVIGWSNSAKKIEGVACFVGKAELDAFLSQTGILICMLPLTQQTENILNKDTFSKLQKEAYVINLARGQHVVDEDLIAAIDSGQLSGACLDVFREEPLPQEHPFWMHPRIHVTPHIASVTNPKTASVQLLENYRRALKAEPLLNEVDRNRGY